MGLCQSCEKKRAIYLIQGDDGSLAVCVDCNLKMTQANALEFNWRASALNHAQAELSFASGLPFHAPMQLVPIQPVAIGGDVVNLHNIKISGDNRGIINTGHLEALDIAIGTLSSEGKTGIAEALKRMAEAVANSNDLEQARQAEVLEMLSLVSEEATKPAKESRGRVALRLAAEVGSILSACASLADLWGKYGSVIQAHFMR